jgi:Spy/CpxP family protein refolding chaperone
MTRVQQVLTPFMALVLGTVVATVATAQAPRGRGVGMGLSRGSLLGLLRIEQVRKDLKLSDEASDKVSALGEKLRTEMREQFTKLREIDGQAQRRAKMTELRDEADRKEREQLRDVLSREQLMRLYQIRMQVRPLAESLANRYVANRLELTEEQKTKLAEVVKQTQEKQTQLRGNMRNLRDATQEQRMELFQKFRKIQTDADAQALGLLTAEQKESLEKMKGAKIELPARRGRQRSA